ncbi:MAG: 3-isopropylmalate dehydratase [Thermoplasmata archaeon]|nr:3-isopropylmalate dehydratase [Thermoplasmata archaeon]
MTVFKGRAWKFDDDIDTDQIFPGKYLPLTDKVEMGKVAMSGVEGFEDFSERISKGDILLAGENFGCGSSRQQAVDCFASLGVSLIVAKSFGAIYERNAINSGFPIVTGDLLGLADGDEIEVDLLSGRIGLPGGREAFAAPFSKVQWDIYQRGGLLR